MNTVVTPNWKRNLDALGSFLGPTGPTRQTGTGGVPGSDPGIRLLRELALVNGYAADLDALAERVGAKFRDCAEAAHTLEAARLVLIDRSGVVPNIRLTEAGRQIALASQSPAP